MKKRGLVIVLISVLALCFVLSGCKDKSWSKVVDKELMLVGLDVNSPPYCFMDENNSIVGFDVDMAMAVGKRLGILVQLNPIDWKNKEGVLAANQADVLWTSYAITDQRKKDMLLSDPYLSGKQVILAKADSAIAAKSDLAGTKIGLTAETAAYDSVTKDPGYDQIKENLITYNSSNAAVKDLDSGAIDAVVLDGFTAKWYMNKNEGKYKVSDDAFGSEQYGIAFRKADKAFYDKVAQAIKELKADGTASRLSMKWFGEDLMQ